MPNHLHDAPSRRTAEERRTQLTMQQLRWRYYALDETTKEVPCTRVHNEGRDRYDLARWVWRKLRNW